MLLQFATIFGAALAVAGALIAFLGLRHAWRASRIARAPRAGTSDADDAAIVRYEGTVVGPGEGEPAEAPFSGTDSVVVRYAVEERQLNPGVPFLRWAVTIEEGTASVPFELRTPAAVVDVDGAIGSALLGSETVATVRAGDALPERIAAFHDAVGLDREPLAFGRLPRPLEALGRRLGLGRRTYSEARLEAGEEALVAGRRVDAGTVDPLVVSDRSARGTFLSMATTGLVAVAIGLAVLAFGLVVALV